MLRGEYVSLRVPEGEDASIIIGWHSDREVTKYLPFILPTSKKQQEILIGKMDLDKNNKKFIIETEDEVPIGICSLLNIDCINSTAEIRVILYAKNCWGRGYGYDTVKALTNYGLFEMNLNTLYVNIMEGNERAVKCFQKAGYEIEGVLYNRLIKEGQSKNLISMSIYKDNKQEG